MAGRRRKRTKLLAEIDRDSVKASKRQPRERQVELPTELLGQILSRLSLKDNIRASAVCKEWLAVALLVRMANRPPWLMYFPKSGYMYEFYDPSQRKSHWLPLPELDDVRICYTKDGWLLLYKAIKKSLFFYHPYTQETIYLPSIELKRQTVAFSTAPTSSSCVVFTVKRVTPTVITVSTCHPGAPKWTNVDHRNHLFVSSFWDKVVYCQGLFYCLCYFGWVGVYDPEKGTWTVQSVPPPVCPDKLHLENWFQGKFMAEHMGDIFVIYSCSAINPVVYKLDQTKKAWMEMKSLGGMSIFANFWSSYAMLDLLGPMRNSVFFPKVRYYGKRCVSYSVNDGRYYPGKQRYDWGEQFPSESVWIEPPKDQSIFL